MDLCRYSTNFDPLPLSRGVHFCIPSPPFIHKETYCSLCNGGVFRVRLGGSGDGVFRDSHWTGQGFCDGAFDASKIVMVLRVSNDGVSLWNSDLGVWMF